MTPFVCFKLLLRIRSSPVDKDGEIRDYLEQLVGRLISENLDDVPLTPLSDDEQCKFFENYRTADL
jgi:hypothetical protein